MAEVRKDTTYYGSYYPDRLYGIKDMNAVIEGIVSDGVLEGFEVTPVSGFTVSVDVGIAKALNAMSRRLEGGEAVTFLVDTPSPTFTRIDSIFYRVDLTVEKRDKLVYRPGVASGSPVAPDKDTSSPTTIKEILIANIIVTAAAPNIIAGDIDNTVKELSGILPLVENAIKATKDDEGNVIKTTYGKEVNNSIYTYDSLIDIGLVNGDFGVNLATSVNNIITALNAKNSDGSASVRTYVSNSDLTNLVSDIQDALNSVSTSFRIEVENVRGEFNGIPSNAFPNRVIIIDNSNGKLYMGTFDINLSPDLAMKELSYKDDDHMQSYDSFEQLDIIDGDFSAVDWDGNAQIIINKIISFSPNNSAIFSLYFTGAGTNPFPNLLASLNAELSLTGNGFTLKVETLFDETFGSAQSKAPTRITVVENSKNSVYVGHYDNDEVPKWLGFKLNDTVEISTSITPGVAFTVVEERIERIGRMVTGSVELSFTTTITAGTTMFFIGELNFQSLIDTPTRGRTDSQGFFDVLCQSFGGEVIYRGTSSLTIPDSIKVSFSYISK